MSYGRLVDLINGLVLFVFTVILCFRSRLESQARLKTQLTAKTDRQSPTDPQSDNPSRRLSDGVHALSSFSDCPSSRVLAFEFLAMIL